MPDDDRRPREGLLVSVDGAAASRLGPAQSPVRFGRGRACHLRLAGVDEHHVSRVAGTLRYDDGLWQVRNESGSRPFHVVVGDAAIPLPPTRPDGVVATWAISPPGLDLRLFTPTREIRVRIRTERPPLAPPAEPAHDDEDPSTARVGPLSRRDRDLLAAKLLADGADGEILGDQAAAQAGNARRPPGTPELTPSAVMNAVRRARDRLTDHGVTGIDGAQNIQRLRRELLAWGLVREEDGRWLWE